MPSVPGDCGWGHLQLPGAAPDLLHLQAQGEGVSRVPGGLQRPPQEAPVRREDRSGTEEAEGGVVPTTGGRLMLDCTNYTNACTLFHLQNKLQIKLLLS